MYKWRIKILYKSKKGLLAFILILVATIGLSFGLNSSAQTKSSIEYRPLKKTGVKIPIRKYDIKDGNKLEFDLYKEDISIMDYIWSWLWGKNFGYYMNGVDPNNINTKCPYLGEKQKRPGSDIQKIGDGKYHVTLVMSQSLIDAIIENKCAVSPKPRKAPDADDNESKNQKKPKGLLFPTIYN